MPDSHIVPAGEEFSSDITHLSSRALGVVLRRYRKSKKITLQQAAEKMGVSISTVQRSERGMRGVTSADLIAFSYIYESGPANILQEALELVSNSKN